MNSNVMPSWFAEPAIAGFQQRAQVSNLIYRGSSPYQEIAVYDTVPFGRTLVLDEAVQTTLKDEFIYHEMLVHPALVTHPRPKRVLIIGGGDGGTLRRVLQHDVDHCTMVEIDQTVVDICTRYLPQIAGDAFSDPRARLIIGDGARFVAETYETFDVVLIDSTDPVGAAKTLFEPHFYRDIARVLSYDGLVVTQSGSPLLMAAELRNAADNVRMALPFARCYLASVPSYPNCLWSFLVAGKDQRLAGTLSQAASLTIRQAVARRIENAALRTSYYSPEIHFACFALPPFISERFSAGTLA